MAACRLTGNVVNQGAATSSASSSVPGPVALGRGVEGIRTPEASMGSAEERFAGVETPADGALVEADGIATSMNAGISRSTGRTAKERDSSRVGMVLGVWGGEAVAASSRFGVALPVDGVRGGSSVAEAERLRARVAMPSRAAGTVNR